MVLSLTDALVLVTSPITLIPTILISLPFAFYLKHRHPNRAFLKCFLTNFCSPLRYIRAGPYVHENDDIYQAALNYAMETTGLDDLGDASFIELHRAVDQYIKYKLSNIGFILVFYQIAIGLFARRLKFIKFVKDNPEINNVPVPSPVFVVGLPRCGTTLLHRLLALDPKVRAPIAWELLEPTPEGLKGAFKDISNEEKIAERLKRTDRVKSFLDMQDTNEFRQIHIIEYDKPEECIFFTSVHLPPLMHHASGLYTGRERWSKPAEGVKAYQLYREFLQSLAYQDGNLPQRWMLKAPLHLHWLPEIQRVFPDAKFIWTHRDPTESVISRLSMDRAVHFSLYDEEGFDNAAFGRDGLAYSADVVHTALQVLSAEEFKCPCKHILYEDIIKSPIDTVKALYADFGWEFTPEYEAILIAALDKDRVERDVLKASGGGAVHKYSAEEFGLTNQQVLDTFDAYIKEFKIPLKQREPKVLNAIHSMS